MLMRNLHERCGNMVCRTTCSYAYWTPGNSYNGKKTERMEGLGLGRLVYDHHRPLVYSARRLMEEEIVG